MYTVFYSSSTNSFFIDTVNFEIPSDAIEISHALHEELLRGQTHGKQIFPPDETHNLPYLAPPKEQYKTLEEAKAEKLQQIDAETSAAILAGFDYEFDGEVLHFSYDIHDQLNFSHAQAMADVSLRDVPGVPQSTSWNGWKIEKDEDGVEISRSLVRLDLDANAFLALFMEGAMMHKSSLMERSGQRKAQVDAAITIEELESI